MSKQTSKLDLSKIPFGRAHSDILIFEENNCDGESFKPGLFFAMLIQGGEPRRQGLVDLQPIYDGQPLQYKYEADAGELRITTDRGNVTVVIDTPRTVRIRGEGIGIRLYTKIPFMTMEHATMLPGGLADLNLMSIDNNGGRFLFKALRGEITLDSFFNVAKNGPEDAKIEFLPDKDGVFEVAGYTMNPDEWGYIDYLPIEEAAAGARADFEEFLKVYGSVENRWRQLRELCAYAVWLHIDGPNDREIIPTMKGDLVFADCLKAGWANVFQQPLHAMAMKDADRAVKLLNDTYVHMTGGMLPASISTFRTHYQGSPPTFGAAVLEIMERGRIPIDEAKRLYGAMEENYRWWKRSHSFRENCFSYNHRDEIKLPGVSYSAFEFPLETPDLYALIILHIEALKKLSGLLEDGRTVDWQAEERAVTERLLELWNGNSFDCRGVISGRRFASKSLLTCMPVVLGGMLPGEIADKIEEDLGDENIFLSPRGLRSESRDSGYYDGVTDGRGAVVAWLQQLIIGGLVRCGKYETAKAAAKRFIKCAEENGPRDVFTAEGEQKVKRPGDFVNAAAGSAVIYLTDKLSN